MTPPPSPVAASVDSSTLLTARQPQAVATRAVTAELTARPETSSGSAASEDDAVTQWWTHLSSVRQQQLCSLSPSEPLPRWAATELWRVGVNCPLALLNERGRMVRRALVPAALARLLRDDQPDSVAPAARSAPDPLAE